MFEQLVVGGKVELFKKSRRIKENGETKEMLVSQIMDINDETIICTCLLYTSPSPRDA